MSPLELVLSITAAATVLTFTYRLFCRLNLLTGKDPLTEFINTSAQETRNLIELGKQREIPRLQKEMERKLRIKQLEQDYDAISLEMDLSQKDRLENILSAADLSPRADFIVHRNALRMKTRQECERTVAELKKDERLYLEHIH